MPSLFCLFALAGCCFLLLKTKISYIINGGYRGLYRLPIDTYKEVIKVNKLLRFFKNLFSGTTTNKNYDSHYQKLDIQPIDRMQRELTHEEFIGYLKGSIIKYDTRAGHKDGESYDKDKTKQKRYEYWLEEALKGHWINPRV